MSTDAHKRLEYLADSVDLLWPAAPHGSAMVVLPGPRAPRLLVPVRPRRAAAAAVRRYTAQQGLRDRVAGTALAAAARAGFCSTRPRVAARTPDPAATSIDDHLAEVLGRRVVTSLALTRPRPNRKPVLQVFDEAGTTIAFAKIGVTELAGLLVDAEGAALDRLAAAGLRHLDIPRVLHRGAWRGCSVLVASALAAGSAVPVGDAALLDAMHEVAGSVRGDLPSYLDDLRARADALGAKAAPWRDVLDALVAARDLTAVPVGAWHGDWTTWNCARHAGRILVWDWERFTAPAPVGFDALHYAFNDGVAADRTRFAAVATTLVAQTDPTLARWALAPRDARSVALLYLLDLALRYLTDDVAATDPAGRVEEWAYPVVRAALTT